MHQFALEFAAELDVKTRKYLIIKLQQISPPVKISLWRNENWPGYLARKLRKCAVFPLLSRVHVKMRLALRKYPSFHDNRNIMNAIIVTSRCLSSVECRMLCGKFSNFDSMISRAALLLQLPPPIHRAALGLLLRRLSSVLCSTIQLVPLSVRGVCVVAIASMSFGSLFGCLIESSIYILAFSIALSLQSSDIVIIFRFYCGTYTGTSAPSRSRRSRSPTHRRARETALRAHRATEITRTHTHCSRRV